MHRNLGLFAAAGLALAAAGCTSGAIDAGYMLLEMDGHIGYATGRQNTGTVDVTSGFGQGDRVGAPYARVELVDDGGTFGAGVLASGFIYDEQGSGTVNVRFGDIPANSSVATDFALVNAKLGVFLNIDFADLLFIRPGIAVDLFFPDMTVTAPQLGIAESIDDLSGVPLPFVQLGLDAGAVSGFIEVGYLPIDSDDVNLGGDYEVETETLDVEAMIKVRPSAAFELFAGYRLFALELRGTVDDDTVDFDVDLAGFMFGGGLFW